MLIPAIPQTLFTAEARKHRENHFINQLDWMHPLRDELSTNDIFGLEDLKGIAFLRASVSPW